MAGAQRLTDKFFLSFYTNISQKLHKLLICRLMTACRSKIYSLFLLFVKPKYWRLEKALNECWTIPISCLALSSFFPRGLFLCKPFVQILVLSLISKRNLRIFSKDLLWKQWVVVFVKSRKLRIRSWVWIWTFMDKKLEFDRVQQINSKSLQWHFSISFTPCRD